MTIKKRTKAATQIVKAKKAEVVWTDTDYERELERAKKIGPKDMSDEALVSFCRGVSSYYHAHFWADARPFFLELWKRINSGKLKMSKTEACRQIGCSRQWANEIVSGRADKRRELRARAKGAKTGKKVSAVNASTSILTNEQYIDEILNQAFAKLRPLLSSHRNRYKHNLQGVGRTLREGCHNPSHR